MASVRVGCAVTVPRLCGRPPPARGGRVGANSRSGPSCRRLRLGLRANPFAPTRCCTVGSETTLEDSLAIHTGPPGRRPTVPAPALRPDRAGRRGHGPGCPLLPQGPLTSGSWYEPLVNGSNSHDLAQILTVGFPLALLLAAVLWLVSKPVRWAVPDAWVPAKEATRGRRPSSARIALWTFYSLILGLVTHIVWDSFTHSYGWMVQQVPFLAAQPIAGVPIYRILQHGSTLAGLVILALWYRKRVKATPDPETRRQAEGRRPAPGTAVAGARNSRPGRRRHRGGGGTLHRHGVHSRDVPLDHHHARRSRLGRGTGGLRNRVARRNCGQKVTCCRRAPTNRPDCCHHRFTAALGSTIRGRFAFCIQSYQWIFRLLEHRLRREERRQKSLPAPNTPLPRRAKIIRIISRCR